MTIQRPNIKEQTFYELIRKFARLIAIGIGLGVISGTSLKIITNKEASGEINIARILKYNILNLGQKTREEKKFLPRKIKSLYKIIVPGNPVEIKSLSNKWGSISKKESDLEASAYLLMLDRGSYAQFNSDIPLPAASSIKISILLAVLEMIEEGKISWDDPLELTQDVVAGGAGWMAYQPLGKKFPVHEVATEMIRVSDNTATNLLIKKIGGIQVINDRFKELDLVSTKINNYLPDLRGTNTTSARDLSHIIALVDTGKLLGPRTRDLFREVLSTSKSNSLLPEGILRGLGLSRGDHDYKLLIKGYRVYNKTGDIGIVYADAGLIELPDSSRAVAGFIVKGPFNDPRSPELIRKMAAAMTKELK